MQKKRFSRHCDHVDHKSAFGWRNFEIKKNPKIYREQVMVHVGISNDGDVASKNMLEVNDIKFATPPQVEKNKTLSYSKKYIRRRYDCT